MSPESKKLHKRRNILMTAAGMAALIGLGFGASHFLQSYKSEVETKFFPAFKDYSATEWLVEDDGRRSSITFLDKVRGECRYNIDQKEVAVGFTLNGKAIETGIEYLKFNEQQEDFSRPVGWQRLARRVKYTNPKIPEGSVLRGSVEHYCDVEHPDRVTTTQWGPIEVGKDSSMPYYVILWMENGRQGFPEDYR